MVPVRTQIVDRTLTDQVVRRLRQQIMLGQLGSGQRLTETQLMRDLGVGRSTVREALRRLEAESLVDSVSHRGSRVAAIAPGDAVQICELHALLESHCLRYQRLPISPDTRERLQSLVDQMRVLVFPAGADRFLELDHEFHRSIVAAAGQRWFLHVWSGINSALGILVTLSIRYLHIDGPWIAERHQAIVDAISAPEMDSDAAVSLAAEHYRSLARMLGTMSPGTNGERPFPEPPR